MAENQKGNLEKVGEGVGAIAGKVADTAVGWMASALGMAVDRLGEVWSDQDDTRYRSDFEQKKHGSTSSSYDAVRPLYQFGHLAGSNPDYQGRSFEDVESELQNMWTGDRAAEYGEWKSVREYINTGYSGRNR